MTRQKTNGPGWLSCDDTQGNLRWEVAEIHRPAIDAMFRLAREGKTPEQIAELLAGKKTFVDGKPWSRKTVDALLRNEQVCGVTELGYPRVVEQELFDSVQALLGNRKGGSSGDMSPNLFRDKVFCECGQKAKLKSAARSYFFCSDASCDAPKHPYEEVERAILVWMGPVDERDEFLREGSPACSVTGKAISALDKLEQDKSEHSQARLGPEGRETLEDQRRRLSAERCLDVEQISLLKKTEATNHPDRGRNQDEDDVPVRVQYLVLYGDERMRAEAKAEWPRPLYTQDGGVVLEYFIENIKQFGRRNTR